MHDGSSPHALTRIHARPTIDKASGAQRQRPWCATYFSPLDNVTSLPLDYVVCNRAVNLIYHCMTKTEQKDLET
jgi:hypothetical protein